MAIKFNEERYREVFQSPAGTVGRFLTRSAIRLESTAKVIATEEKLVRTGNYRARLTARVFTEASGLVIKLGSAVPYARFLEHGTPPHLILPRARVTRALGNLPIEGERNFLWWTHGADRGWVVPRHPPGFDLVHHPGTRAYGVLHRAVAQVFRR